MKAPRRAFICAIQPHRKRVLAGDGRLWFRLDTRNHSRPTWDNQHIFSVRQGGNVTKGNQNARRA